MKRFLLLLVSVFIAASIDAQSFTMKDAFLSMPDSILPLLTANNRKDMVDFMANNMEARVRDRLDNHAELKVLRDTYLSAEMTPNSCIEMKLLHTRDSVALIALIRTVKAPASDSQIEFYNSNWQRLSWIEFPRSEVSEFWSEAPDSIASDARYAQQSLNDLCMMEIKALPEDPVFEVTLQISELAEKEKDAAKQLVHPIRYVWTGSEFRKR